MKPSEITKEVERFFFLLKSYNGNTFGQIKIIRTKRVRMNSAIPCGGHLLWEPDDFKPLFQVEHQMAGLFQDPLCFSIGRKEVCISTWYFGTGNSEKVVLSHPFVMSWTKFLETNKIPQDLGLSGHCLPTLFPLEEGLRILQLWIKWVLKYS